MSKLKIPAAILVIGVMSLGVPAIAAPVTSLSAAAKPMAQETDLVKVRFGRWHGGRHSSYNCHPYCGWGG
jgi:putative alpha-1,2-mannosidase